MRVQPVERFAGVAHNQVRSVASDAPAVLQRSGDLLRKEREVCFTGGGRPQSVCALLQPSWEDTARCSAPAPANCLAMHRTLLGIVKVVHRVAPAPAAHYKTLLEV